MSVFMKAFKMTWNIHPDHWSELAKKTHMCINTTHIKEITGEAGASFKNRYEPQGSWGAPVWVKCNIPLIKDKCVLGLDKARSWSTLGQHHGQLPAASCQQQLEGTQTLNDDMDPINWIYCNKGDQMIRLGLELDLAPASFGSLGSSWWMKQQQRRGQIKFYDSQLK